VAYDGGKPEFKTIEDDHRRARVNTDKGRVQGQRTSTTCASRACGSSRPSPTALEVADSIPKEIYQIPVSSSAHNVTYVTVEESNDDAGGVRDGCGLHRTDDRVGLRGLGQRLLLSAVLGLRLRLSDATTAVIRPTATAPGTTLDRARTDAAWACTDRMAAPAWARDTTRAPALMREVRSRMVPTARAVCPVRTTRAPARRPRRGKVRARTAVGARPPFHAATTGRRPVGTPTTAVPPRG
jgi:hypothetical protein